MIDWAAGLFILAGLILWLVLALVNRRDRKRLLDPDFSFPHLGPTDPPHEFSPFGGLTVCGKCGGGKKHPIHTGGPWPVRPGGIAKSTHTRVPSDSASGSSIAETGAFGDRAKQSLPFE